MAERAGKDGSVTLTGMQANAYGWVLSYEADELDITDFGDAGVSDYIAGLTRWGGTINIRWDAANTKVVGTSASLTLQAYTGKTYTGTCLFTNESTTVSVEALNETVATFRGKGILTKPS